MDRRTGVARLDGSQLTIENVRNFEFRSDTDFTEHWEARHQLAERPRWYDALSHNCTTTIRHHVQAVGPSNPWD